MISQYSKTAYAKLRNSKNIYVACLFYANSVNSLIVLTNLLQILYEVHSDGIYRMYTVSKLNKRRHVAGATYIEPNTQLVNTHLTLQCIVKINRFVRKIDLKP